MKYVTQKSANTIVLGYFFARSQTTNYKLTTTDLIEAFEGKLGAIRVEMALDTILKNEYATDANLEGSEYVYVLSSEGYKKAEEFFLSSKENFVKTIVEHGLDGLFEKLEKQETESNRNAENKIPASDRFITISDNSAGITEIVTAIEEAEESVRGSNDISVEERSWVRTHLEVGVMILKKGGKVLQSAIKSLIIEPLEAALKASSEENLRKAIEAALKALRTYLGIF